MNKLSIKPCPDIELITKDQYNAELFDVFTDPQKLPLSFEKFKSIVAVYGKENVFKIIKAILSYKAFGGYDHLSKFHEILIVYGEIDKKTGEIINYKKLIDIVLKNPFFIGRVHSRVLQSLSAVYGDSNEIQLKIKKAIINYPPFVGLDHLRVIDDCKKIFGENNEARIKKLLLNYPNFSGSDYEKRFFKLKELIKKMSLNINDNELVEMILKCPFIMTSSIKRHIAVIDILLKIKEEFNLSMYELLEDYLSYPTRSPYMKDADGKRTKRRISKRKSGDTDPDLYKALIARHSKKN